MRMESWLDVAAERAPPSRFSTPGWLHRLLRRWRSVPAPAAAPGAAAPRLPDNALADFAETQPSCHFL